MLSVREVSMQGNRSNFARTLLICKKNKFVKYRGKGKLDIRYKVGETGTILCRGIFLQRCRRPET